MEQSVTHQLITSHLTGLRCVIAKSFARIHHHNLVNFGALPLTLTEPESHDRIHPDDQLGLDDLPQSLASEQPLTLRNLSTGESLQVRHRLSRRQQSILRAGGLIATLRPDHGARPEN